jgi:general stress protein YciG
LRFAGSMLIATYDNERGLLTMPHANPGNFANDRTRAQRAGRKGGSMSPGNFKYNRKRAVEAGRKGGLSKA